MTCRKTLDIQPKFRVEVTNDRQTDLFSEGKRFRGTRVDSLSRSKHPRDPLPFFRVPGTFYHVPPTSYLHTKRRAEDDGTLGSEVVRDRSLSRGWTTLPLRWGLWFSRSTSGGSPTGPRDGWPQFTSPGSRRYVFRSRRNETGKRPRRKTLGNVPVRLTLTVKGSS